jgi:UDP-N-acetylglucosamine 4,6-dehydratase
MPRFPRILITGGTGTLGSAIIRALASANWASEVVLFSRDPLKHQTTARVFPDCKHIIGDVGDFREVFRAVEGADLVLHLAAMKHIPEGENAPAAMYRVNVTGSYNVAQACMWHKVAHVVGISTDKACWPINAYGCTKMMMERMFQEFAHSSSTAFHLVRYGNVIGSTGSVVPVWRKMAEIDGEVRATSPCMTRFWMTATQAASLVLQCVDEPSGTVLIPHLGALRMSDLARLALGDTPIYYMGLRPGEKMHEMLLTPEEALRSEMVDCETKIRLYPPGTSTLPNHAEPYTSDKPVRWLTDEETMNLLEVA